MLDNMYSVQQTAKSLGVSTRTIHRFIRGEGGREKLPAQKIGNAWRLKENDVKVFVNRQNNA